MEKTGVDFIPRKTHLSVVERELMRNFGGLKAYGFINMLENIIARPGSCGYYMNVNKSTYGAIAQELDCNTSYVRDIIRALLNREYYDLDKFRKYHILTNAKIQHDVIIKVYGSATKLDYGELRKEYLLNSIISKMQKNARFREFFEENYQSNGETRQDNNFTNPNIKRDNNNSTSTNADSKSLSAIKIEKFVGRFPKVPLGDKDLIIPGYVNIDTLIEKYNESPQWLQIARNMTLAWACKQDNYQKILNDNYKLKPGISCQTNTNKQKTVENKEDLDYLFDNTCEPEQIEQINNDDVIIEIKGEKL